MNGGDKNKIIKLKRKNKGNDDIVSLIVTSPPRTYLLSGLCVLTFHLLMKAAQLTERQYEVVILE